MNTREYIGRWELICIVFNSVLYKLFVARPEAYIEYGGAAAWLCALFSGLIFLAVLYLLLKLYSPIADEGIISFAARRSHRLSALISGAAAVYFSLSFLYVLYSAYNALRASAYAKSPLWFISLFLIGASLCAVIYGRRSVLRIHSLCAAGSAAALLLIVLLSLRSGDIYNITPILGKGALSTFGKGLSTLTMHSGAAAIFFLPRHKAPYSYTKTVMGAASAAVIINVLVIISFSLNFSYEAAEAVHPLLLTLTKSSEVNSIAAHPDLIYLGALINSVLLYLTLSLYIARKCAAHCIKRHKRISSAILCLLLTLSLCGCYDGSEVERSAYVVAIGVDSVGDGGYRYTFQLSNPLESGGSMGAEEKSAENSGSESEGSKTVDNVTVNAGSLDAAKDRLQSLISKNISLSHMKLAVFSFAAADRSMLSHTRELLNSSEVRPSVNLCLSDNAEEFLKSVDPTLEVSAVRYYELFFGNENLPYAPTSQLRDFVNRSLDKAYDAVVPIVGKDGLSGMEIFSDGTPAARLGAREAMAYKLLTGSLSDACIEDGDSYAVISCTKKPHIKVSKSTDGTNVSICLKINIKALYGNMDISAHVESMLRDTVSQCQNTGCDILGIGRKIKGRCLTQSSWESVHTHDNVNSWQFNYNILLNNGNSNQFLQN